MQQRVSVITLGVADVHRARDFYTALGWRFDTPDDDVFFGQAGGLIVSLWSRAKLAEDTVVTDGGGWGGVTFGYNVSSPEEVDAVMAEVDKAGGTVGRPAGKTFWGGYSATFADPDGHTWEVAHNPYWVVHDDGTTTLS